MNPLFVGFQVGNKIGEREKREERKREEREREIKRKREREGASKRQKQIESNYVFSLRSPAPGPLVCSKRVATSAGGVCVILELPCNCRMVPVWVHFRSTPWMDRWPDDVVFRVALGPVYR